MKEGSADRSGAIETSGLTKRYGNVEALTDLTLRVPAGSIYGFLGPNGAGKTTTIKLLMGFIRPSSGFARIGGHETWRDGVAARRDLGFLVQPDNLFSDMTGAAHLEFAARLSGAVPRLQTRLLDALELGPEALGRKLGSYSKGMRQKLALVAAMQADPRTLILDEPTDGLDPLIQRNFEELLLERQSAGRTIFMSSHDLAEVERTCRLVAIVKDGRLVAEETVDGLKRLHRRRAKVRFTGAVPAGAERIAGTSVVERSGERIELLIEGDVNPLLDFLSGHPVADVVITPPSLDDIFLGFYGTARSTNGHAVVDGTEAVVVRR